MSNYKWFVKRWRRWHDWFGRASCLSPCWGSSTGHSHLLPRALEIYILTLVTIQIAFPLAPRCGMKSIQKLIKTKHSDTNRATNEGRALALCSRGGKGIPQSEQTNRSYFISPTTKKTTRTKPEIWIENTFPSAGRTIYELWGVFFCVEYSIWNTLGIINLSAGTAGGF